jgi:hypothetical protein
MMNPRGLRQSGTVPHPANRAEVMQLTARENHHHKLLITGMI